MVENEEAQNGFTLLRIKTTGTRVNVAVNRQVPWREGGGVLCS